MPCYHPISGFICQDGRFRVFPKGDSRPQVVPCNGCVGCRLERSRQWAIRVMHEASLYKRNCFITLTYDVKRMPAVRPAGVPPADVGLHYPDFQDFMKRLRKHFGPGIRFYMCGEYGENRGRPHFHVCIFNLDFDDKYYWRKTKQGYPVYRSPVLESLWTFGNSEIGNVTFQSAAYVARYIMKKVTGNDADLAYQYVDSSTGEVFDRVPEFTHMSLKPGIAYGWLQKFHSDVYPNDYVIMNGRKVRPPRYYDRKYFDMTGVVFQRDVSLSDGVVIGSEDIIASIEIDDLKFSRELEAKKHVDDNTPSRLLVKEQLAVARLSRLKRTII